MDSNLDVLLGALSHGSLSITHVFVKDPALHSFALSLMNDSEAEVLAWDLTMVLPSRPCTLALISFRLNPRLFQALGDAGVVAILGTGGYRRVCRPWRLISLSLLHSDLGGVTATGKSLQLFRLVNSWSEDALNRSHPSVPRDLGTLLSYGAEVLRRAGPPAMQQVEPLRAHSVQRDPLCGSPIYHGRGLLPACPSPETLVLTPSKGSWGIRCLTRVELLQAYDIGDRFHQALPLDYALARTVPISMITESLHIISPLLQHIRGGDFTTFTSPAEGTTPATPSKRGAHPRAAIQPERKPFGKPKSNVGTSSLGDNWTEGETATMQTDSLFEDDVNSFAPTIGHSNRGPLVLTHIPKEITIPGATSLRCTPDIGIQLAPQPSALSPVSDPWIPKGPMPGRRTSQRNPWRDSTRDSPAPASEEDSGETTSREERDKTATKSDKAPVPTYLWEEHLVADGPTPWSPEQQKGLPRAMDLARKFGLRWWKKSLYRGFMRWAGSKHSKQVRRASAWIRRKGPSVRWDPLTNQYTWSAGGKSTYRSWWVRRYRARDDYNAGRDALYRAMWSSWWDWDAGSRPFFWRWPPDSQELMRDGMMVYFVDKAPVYVEGQPRDRDPESKALTEEKLQKVIDRGYLENSELIVSLTSFFSVPKGETDIRMVYDGTKCGLNGSVWVPTFYMPTLTSHLRAVVEGTHMCDVDIGEMFLNFMLHPTLRILCGVDLTNYDLDLSSLEVPVDPAEVKAWVSWNRIAMGLKWSPYQAIKSMHFAEEVTRGDRKDPNNVFSWDRVRLNLPGQPVYDPSLPWVSKVKDLEDGTVAVAADLFTFCDDLRPVGATKKEGWKAGSSAASIINWLGLVGKSPPVP